MYLNVSELYNTIFIKFSTKKFQLILFSFSLMHCKIYPLFNPLTPNDPYRNLTAPLTSKRCIFYIFIQQMQLLNILNTVYSLRFFLFKMQFVS